MLELYLKELTLRNYRNYNNLELHFSSNLVVFVGKNAQGKTNIIESIFLSCTGRSHRTPKDKELIRWNEEGAFVKTSIAKSSGGSTIEILIKQNDKKKIIINYMPISRLVELMGHLNCVIFAPEDLKLVKEGPSERRRFMDMELSQIRPKYFYYLQQYNRILNHRNNLLKDIYKKPSLVKTLSIWNMQLSETGSFIIMQRHLFNTSLQTIARKIHSRISSQTEELGIRYLSSIPYQQGTQKEIMESFLNELEKREKIDIERGITTRGCHRDDIHITINDVDIRTFGSQGQQRTAALSLKLSELEFMYGETGEYPVLLLDDVMSELDPHRQRMLIEHIENVQTFITTTDINQIPEIMNKNREVFIVNQGTVDYIK